MNSRRFRPRGRPREHGHIWHYAAFALSMTVLAAALILLDMRLTQRGVELPRWAEGWIALPPVILAAACLPRVRILCAL